MGIKAQAAVIWITGLPASGKTTLAQALKRFLEEKGLPVEHLDGDELRNLFPQTGFDRASRDMHVKRVGHLASRLESHGVWVIVSLVSPYQESRNFSRNMCQRFVEVYLNTPLERCIERDPKGLYKKAKEGNIENLTGLQSDYEAPQNPDLRIDNSELSVEDSLRRIVSKLFP